LRLAAKAFPCWLRVSELDNHLVRLMLKTKSIYDPTAEADGLRLLVSRYWPRGVKKERTDHWFRDLGPRPALISAWKSAQVTWLEFTALYLGEFDSSARRDAFASAASLIKGAERAVETPGGACSVVTLLCTCRDGTHCHRELLRDTFEREINL